MKKLKVIVLIICGVFLLSGCGIKKESITASDFLNKTSGIVTVANYTSYYGIAKTAYQTSQTEYKVLFIEGKNISDIKGMFIDEAKNVYGKAGIDEDSDSNKKITKTTASGKNWSSVEITNEYSYYYLAYIDNTILYLEGNIDQKDLLIKVKDAIKY